MGPDLNIKTVCQNYTVKDFEGNLAKIQDAYAHALDTKTDLLVTTELSLSGYPLEDAVENPDVLEAAQVSLEAVKAMTKGKQTAIIVGLPVKKKNGLIYNTSVVVQDGKVIGRSEKKHRPNYGVFDEARNFAQGVYNKPFTLNGVTLGLLICEDTWFPDVAARLKKNGADMLISVNASPYETGKQSLREQEVMRKRIQETDLPMLYVNQLGGQDELFFDGGAYMALPGEDPLLVELTPNFTEGYGFVEAEAGGGVYLDFDQRYKNLDDVTDRIGDMDERLERGPQTQEDIADQQLGDDYNALVWAVRSYAQKTGLTKACLGMSGGVDSALVAAIAVDALGPENVKLYSMPSKYTSDESNSLAYEEANRLGVSIESMPIQGIVDEFMKAVLPKQPGDLERITIENLQARTRGTLLMGISNNTQSMMVLSTGNKSENAIGYATLYGDMNGGYNPLKDVLKTQVFKLCEWRNNNRPVLNADGPLNVIPTEIINRPPTAELFEGQQDSDSLPPYEILDEIIMRYAENDEAITDIATAMGQDEDFILKWTSKIDIAQYKRDQSCPGPKIRPRDFERDRRYPNAARTISAVRGFVRSNSQPKP